MIKPHWIQEAMQAALAAGSKIMSLKDSPDQPDFKKGLDGRPSTVTQADTSSEKIISSILKEKFPDHGIYGEEGERRQLDHDFVWYIDPIDGTTNYWRNIPLFGISIGLTFQKAPVLGVLYFPELELMVHASQGTGAFANDRPIRVSDRSLKQSLYYLSCQELRDGPRYPQLTQAVGWVRAIDASSYEFAQIAMGDAEVYTFFSKTPHDMVAGCAIINEAGGRVSDERGQEWSVDSEFIIATNGLIHDQVLKLVEHDLGG